MDLIRRDAWGAAAPRGKPVVIPTPVRDLFLHHSATPDGGPETVRAIQKFHQQTRGWADIAYTWLYSPRDRVFYEGRGPAVAGAHTRNHNRTSHAVCILGNYDVTAFPNHAIHDLADWARWHGTAWGPNRYRPHSEVAATACPGKHVMNVLRDINLYAEAEMAPSTPVAPPAPVYPPNLRLGATGDDVKLMQQAILPHDGIFGPATDAALRHYQQANGLTVDGICGPKTWASILAG
jgi:peptidoglycan hydrolase-like protein with peptidoglycan-binding domain